MRGIGAGSRQSAKAPSRSLALWHFGKRSFFALSLIPCVLAATQTPAPEESKKPAAPLEVAPRAYFAAHCQRCHGIDGGNFIPGFADEPAEKLRADIVRMADGPGAAPLKPEDVDVQFAYHKLISAQKPFVSWTGREGLTLKGEVSDGAKLTASVGTLRLDDDSNWTLILPSEADLKGLRLTATMDKATTEFAPSDSAFARLPQKKDAPPKP